MNHSTTVKVKKGLSTGLGVLVILSSFNSSAEIVFNLAGDTELTISGYLREYLAINLHDQPDILANGKKLGGAGDLNMVRSTVLLQGRYKITDKLSFGGVYRASREYKTNYLEDLENSSTANVMGRYDENEMREWYADLDMANWGHLRLGRQQVAWGETDSFQALDVVNPFDFSWRSSLEAENEELRTPLIMANLELYFPKLQDGTLQLLYRPGWDKDEDVGHTLDFFGGRWALRGSKGFDTNSVFPFNYDHSKGDTDDASYGTRWTGTTASGVGYSLAYYHTVSANPILNVGPFLNPLAASYGEGPANMLGEFILPEIDIYGGSINAYWGWADTVIRSEFTFTPDLPYNFGFIGTPIAGAGGIVEMDTFRLMLGADKLLQWTQNILGTRKPGTMVLQAFDTWIPDLERSDMITDIGFSQKKEHSVVLSAVLALNYKYDRVNPTLVGIWDPTYGGGAVIPQISFSYGDHWRLLLESIFYFKSGQSCSLDPGTANAFNDCTHTFGSFDDRDQITARLTYQF